MRNHWRWLNSRVCPRWFIGSFDNPIRRAFQDPRAILTGLVEPGQTAVDIGCGIGYFTVALAELVGPAGRVVAVDLQTAMLEGARRRAERAGLLDRVRFHQALPGGIGLSGPADFVLAFWMVHEVPDRAALFRQIRELLSPEGRCLVVEPKIHVSEAAFRDTVETAIGVGLVRVAAPRVSLSRAALLLSASP